MQRPKFISPGQFTSAFVKVVASNNDQLADWYLADYTKYTDFMLNTVLKEVAQQLEVKCWSNNYFYMDAVFHTGFDEEHFPKNSTNAPYWEVAIEHEHILSGTAQEINKLQLFNAPLKVLITYDEGKTKLRDKKLQTYVEIIKAADIFKDIGITRKQLVLFGRKLDNRILWDAFEYREEGFAAILL